MPDQEAVAGSDTFAVVICSKYEQNLRHSMAALTRNEHMDDGRIIVVDDGAGTGAARADLPGVQWVPGKAPFSFPRNVNIGIRRAWETLGEGCDIILMNDDAQLTTKNGFSLLREICYAETGRGEKVGMIAPSCDDVGCVAQKVSGSQDLRYYPMVCFVTVYLRAAMLHDIGLLEEAFPGYGYDDNDMCIRAGQEGWKIAITERVFMDHATLPSSFRVIERKDFENRYRAGAEAFQLKWGKK